jgi:alpha-mannosidase
VTAQLFGAVPYPREKLNRAWGLVLGSQMHDMLPGTCLPKAYEYCWNDEIIALNNFASVLETGVGGVARALDTQVDGVPVVVFNPLSFEREDVVEIEIELPAGTTAAQVCTADGKPLPTQALGVTDNKHRLLFLGKVPSLGFAVFAVKAVAAPANGSALRVGERTLENARYRVTLDDAGDIASAFDKAANRELLAAPARLAFLTENPAHWPAWNMDWKDRTNAPRSYVGGPAKIRVVENGPVRVAIEIERAAENSFFVQTVRLAAGDAGNKVEVVNRIDWQSRACSLKAEFPLAVANPTATYNWELGKIQRTNNDRRKYEVPSRQWFDLTDARGDYGVSILAPDKYGSDKPNDTTLRLTLLYTPGVAAGGNYQEQKYQDWGRHDIVYGFTGHRGDWRAGKTDWEAARLSQPLRAFRTPPHPGQLGHTFSLLKVDSEQVAVRAVKLAEDNDQIIVRLQELNGTPVRQVKLTSAAGFKKVATINGIERDPQPFKFSRDSVTLDFKPYQLRSLAISLPSPVKLAAAAAQPVKLPFNLDAFSSNEHKQDGAFDNDGATYPADMIGDTLVADGIKFEIGPRQDRQRNVVACQGQEISLPAGKFNRLYLLASSVYGDAEGVFQAGGRSTTLSVQDWSGYIGSWDNRVFAGVVPERTFSVNNPLERIATGYIKRDPLAWFCSHRHQRVGNDEVYKYTYLFKYALELPAGAKTLKLPDNPRLRIFAVTAAQNENDAVVSLQPLYDDFAGRESVKLRKVE